jgi:hypothetical protein
VGTSLDVTSDSNNGGAPMNPYDWRRDYGNAPFDIRHRLVATYIYSIPLFSKSSGFVKRHSAAGRLTESRRCRRDAVQFVNEYGRGKYQFTGSAAAGPAQDSGVQLRRRPLAGCIDKSAFAVPAISLRASSLTATPEKHPAWTTPVQHRYVAVQDVFAEGAAAVYVPRGGFQCLEQSEFSAPNANIEALRWEYHVDFDRFAGDAARRKLSF